MPIHDWTRVEAGLFHHFHLCWICALSDALNAALPSEYFALMAQRKQGPVTDDLTLEQEPRTEAEIYARKANRLTVRHIRGDIVAVVEIVSPGNKGSRADFQQFVEKAAALISQGVNLLVIDLFPPSKRDPQGIHKALWDEFKEEDLEQPPDKPLTLASYDAGEERVAYVEFVGVGDTLPDMPLFLKPQVYVPAPLESSYQSAWHAFPAALRGLLE